jgi:integrating conjugative element relaxase (TIGR03760 family)
MGWVLKWRKAKGSTVPKPAADLAIGCLRAESARALMATPRRTKLIEHIWQRTSLSRQQFDRLYLEPLHRFAELVQHLPASRNHHHAYHGGMLDHGLEIVAYALKMRQSYMLPLGTTPETQAAQTEAWTAAIAYAALLHDIGKIAVDVEVDLASGKRWHPWQGPIKGDYRFRFVEGREYKLHAAAAGLIYNQVLSSRVMD